MKSYKKQSGFTIVELLIVIVVIGILAAITIVAYNGIQNRSKATSAQSLAGQVAKKAEAWNSVQGSYPTSCQLITNTIDGVDDGTSQNKCTTGTQPGPKEAALDNASTVHVAYSGAYGFMPADHTTVSYNKCNDGAAVYWYDATNASAQPTMKVQVLGIGGHASIVAPNVSTAGC
jgi:prepilin-type N-terminal cleavage/methylation domain-containing protein